MASDPNSRQFVRRPPVTRHTYDEQGQPDGVYIQDDGTLEVIAMALDVQCPVCGFLPGHACKNENKGALVIHTRRVAKGREFSRPPK